MTNGAAVLTVRDHGRGLNEESVAHVFDRFWQGDKARVGAGVGLGLSIVRRTAGLLGHHIAVRSAPGEGSCFQIEVPSGSWRHVTHT